MPYAKGGEAEKLAKMRRSLTDKAKRIEAQIQKGKYAAGRAIETARATAQQYRRQAAELYATKREEGKRVRKSAGEIQRALTYGKRAVEGAKINIGSNQGRKNILFQKELNNPDTSISRFSHEDVQLAYRLSIDLWAGGEGNRNQMIADALGVTDFELAFELIDVAKRGFLRRQENGEIIISSDEAPELSEKGSGKKSRSPDSFSAYTNFDSSKIIDYMYDNDIMEAFARHKDVMSREDVKEWFATYKHYDDSKIEALLSEKYDNE